MKAKLFEVDSWHEKQYPQKVQCLPFLPDICDEVTSQPEQGGRFALIFSLMTSSKKTNRLLSVKSNQRLGRRGWKTWTTHTKTQETLKHNFSPAIVSF